MPASLSEQADWTSNPTYPLVQTVYTLLVSAIGSNQSYSVHGTLDGAAYSLVEVRQRTAVGGVPVTGWSAWSTIPGTSLSNTYLIGFTNYSAPETSEVEIRVTAETPGTYTLTLTSQPYPSGTVQDTQTTSLTIEEAPALVPPTAEFDAHPLLGPPTLTVAVDASASTDDNAIITYTWNWGDDSADEINVTPTASHDYDTVGTYTITLTVADGEGQTDAATATITVAYATVTEAYAGQPIIIRQT